jgi:glycosyltransferase involved in cell wall biosynthesis
MPSVDTIATRAKCPARLLDLAVAGVPVAAHDVGEARTYVQDGVNGVLVSDPDVDSLARAAVNLVQAGSRPRDRGAFESLENGALSPARAADDLAAIYGQALRRRAVR